MSFKEALESGKFAVTAEVGPPKGTDIKEMRHHMEKEMRHHMEILKGKLDAVNVTDNQSAVMRISSTAVCVIAMQEGLEPILQMTCRDRNRIGLQSDLLGASILGIKNVLCMTGDHVSAGDHKGAKPVYDLESVQLLKVVDGLNNGKDMMGNELQGSTDFFQGAVVTPEAVPNEPQLMKFDKKVAAGANFFQTQAIYDIESFKKFMSHARQFPVKVLAGFVVLKSVGMAKFLNNFVPGIKVTA
jgi:5,10-methylenetetrahydrofolate reductase